MSNTLFVFKNMHFGHRCGNGRKKGEEAIMHTKKAREHTRAGLPILKHCRKSDQEIG